MKIWVNIITCLAVIYIATTTGLVIFQRDLLFAPNPNRMPPSALRLGKAEVIWLATPDGEKIVSWYIPSKDGRPLVVYFHGNAGRLADRVEIFREMTNKGLGLLAIDYRGYGGSSGSPSEAGLMADGEAAYAEAISLGYTPDNIAFVGESLGTAIAVEMAARHPVSSIILDSGFTSIEDTAAERFDTFPVRLFIKDKFRSDLRIDKVHSPLLMIHGQFDDVIPLYFGERLFVKANEPKAFHKWFGLGHVALRDPSMVALAQAWIEKWAPLKDASKDVSK